MVGLVEVSLTPFPFFGSVCTDSGCIRYNTFFVLYPLGISSECWLIYLAIQPAKRYNAALEWVLKLILFVYIPGKLWPDTHMPVDSLTKTIE